jgi:hypothetical protein
MKHRCHWRYRDMIRKGKITATRYRCTEQEARERYGEYLIGVIPGSAEERAEPTEDETRANQPGMVNRDQTE